MTHAAPEPAPRSEDPVVRRAALAAAERHAAALIDPGGRAVVVAVGVLVLSASLALPHAGAANGWQMLFAAPSAAAETITLPSRIFLTLAAACGIGISILALVTRRWVLAWIAAAGCTLASAFGALAVWSRQTLDPVLNGSGPGAGLFLGWATVAVLAFHWIRVVWARSSTLLEAQQRRREGEAELPDEFHYRLGPPPRG
ncbi:hypothetical protein [Rhodococcus pyridinivorans]|uniref:Rv2732c family membrane protein n=1 Tax=Rhodococcus pyridinivorans TaxID=103816 RepID=UPI00228403C4|nr:hypothetical protein [Rhodococcus pyridinivorans]WAL49874.1 hypothetical protein OQN32_28270 [Rhodococcus pyridinivorans]